MRHGAATLSLAVAVCLLAFSPEAAQIPVGDQPAGGLLSQRPAEIPPDAWRRILAGIERDGYAVRPVAEVTAEETREEAILRASDAQGAALFTDGDIFGVSVAISGDTALVGAFFEDGGPGDPANAAGATYVFPTSFFGIFIAGLPEPGRVPLLAPAAR